MAQDRAISSSSVKDVGVRMTECPSDKRGSLAIANRIFYGVIGNAPQLSPPMRSYPLAGIMWLISAGCQSPDPIAID